ncbi:hypothetical protein FE633_19190 [Streptomyces montanus]|uniref:DUF6242 domain-containing protein n=1 Tax=Streptomyces montanus TaxID=2580423 RepID=A0A5R9FTN2_9ACTN|nr:hypothetical protein [Streptomyces montanus]TLS44688.1 hypothetical protein FE633_19190 [Streptomyces montanus]
MNMRMLKVNAVLAVLLLLFVSVVALRAVIDSGKAWKYDKVFTDTGTLSAVIATADDDIWAAGDGLLLHDDGTGWQHRPMPASLGARVFDHVRFDAVDSGGFLFTASLDEGNVSRMARWDGTRWTALPELPDGRRVKDVRAFTEDDIWVLDGKTGAYHWDGTGWTAMDLPVTVTALDGVASDDLWAVGYHYPDGPDEHLGLPGAQPATMHWDGRAWKPVRTPEYHYSVPAPEELAYFTEVAALAKDDVRVYGEHPSISEDDESDPPPEAIRRRWNGTRWITLPNSEGACSARGRWVDDGKRGAVLSASRYLTADGLCEGIAQSKLPSTDGIESDSKQSLRLNAITAVPGTDKIIGVGSAGDSLVIVSLKR